MKDLSSIIKENKNTILFCIMIVGSFAILFTFFMYICPLIPITTDDWFYLGLMRKLPLPMTGVTNPIKVLPEVLEPLCGGFASYVLYPITKDYILSINIISAFVVSFFIMFMIVEFKKYVSKCYGLSERISIVFSVLFLALFFWLFKNHNESENMYALWATDLNCYYNYIIPGCLNAGLVFLLKCHEDEDIKLFDKDDFVILILVYFSIFSSVQLSIILASYSFIRACRVYKERKKIDRFAIVVFGVWCVSLIFEFNGNRAHDVMRDGFRREFISVLHSLVELLRTINTLYWLFFFIGSTIFAFIVIGKKKGSMITDRYLFEWIQLVIIVIYLVFTYSLAGARYISRPDAMWAFLFQFISVSILSWTMICKHVERIKTFIAFFTLIIVLDCFNLNNPYIHYYYGKMRLKEFDDYIIEEMVKADDLGKDKVVLNVPLQNGSYNWPQSSGLEYALPRSLYYNGVVKRMIEVHIEPSEGTRAYYYR